MPSKETRLREMLRLLQHHIGGHVRSFVGHFIVSFFVCILVGTFVGSFIVSFSVGGLVVSFIGPFFVGFFVGPNYFLHS